ncbi:MAG: hypothetical protein LC739_08985 [Actinobacteria bacterium]|nr:hypothetical protein [Actinomycetota bacterium]
MSHPDGLPDLFLDRSLGRIKVPALLRAAGLRLTTLAEHYGLPADDDIRDADWLELAGRNGWAVFMKDARVRYNRAERDAVKTHRVRCFCLSNRNLSGADMAARFLDNLVSITAACSRPGPFVYAVHKSRIDRLELATK